MANWRHLARGLVAFVGAIALASQASCIGKDRVAVEVTLDSTAAPIKSLCVLAGGDKSCWQELRPGKRAFVALIPVGPPLQLTVMYKVGDRQTTWEGPSIPGTTGYRIAVKISANGLVTSRHCMLPCRL